MKKRSVWIIILTISVCYNSFGQFELTKTGLTTTSNSVKDYIIYEYKEISQEDIYKGALQFIQSKYKHPKNVLNEIPSESIIIHGIQPDAIGIPYKSKVDQKILGKYSNFVTLKYSISLKFKDNKLRIDIPDFEHNKVATNHTTGISLTGKMKKIFSSGIIIFDTDSDRVETDAKEQIEKFFNSFCFELNNFILTKIESDKDW